MAGKERGHRTQTDLATVRSDDILQQLALNRYFRCNIESYPIKELPRILLHNPMSLSPSLEIALNSWSRPVARDEETEPMSSGSHNEHFGHRRDIRNSHLLPISPASIGLFSPPKQHWRPSIPTYLQSSRHLRLSPYSIIQPT